MTLILYVIIKYFEGRFFVLLTYYWGLQRQKKTGGHQHVLTLLPKKVFQRVFLLPFVTFIVSGSFKRILKLTKHSDIAKIINNCFFTFLLGCANCWSVVPKFEVFNWCLLWRIKKMIKLFPGYQGNPAHDGLVVKGKLFQYTYLYNALF